MPFESVLFSAGIRIDTVDVILLILYGHWALGLGSGEKRVLPFTAGGWLGAIFLAWIACLFFLSLAVAKEPRFGLYETFAIAKGFLLFFYLVNNVTTHHDSTFALGVKARLDELQSLLHGAFDNFAD